MTMDCVDKRELLTKVNWLILKHLKGSSNSLFKKKLSNKYFFEKFDKVILSSQIISKTPPSPTQNRAISIQNAIYWINLIFREIWWNQLLVWKWLVDFLLFSRTKLLLIGFDFWFSPVLLIRYEILEQKSENSSSSQNV